ncbi:hypothetical protein RIVM261_024900 [Rivularia sp. IAM M-261]|nr:hypothetical protein RIVM261_024900 [Rivularia sp. IAM M-261]
MDNQIEHQIIEAEEKLRLAMLHSDVKALDELLSSRLIFTNHQGHLVSCIGGFSWPQIRRP